jgi:hypothetical protein
VKTFRNRALLRKDLGSPQKPIYLEIEGSGRKHLFEGE